MSKLILANDGIDAVGKSLLEKAGFTVVTEKVAQENFEVANEQYKVGVITSIELRDAQLNLLNSELRLFTAQYENKLNETELLRLTGDLVKL